ncbi:MAG: pantoate--beta-alanine ligase [Candidatus Tenebribacter burtonii]|jgi:pantoate--beta-alanine ligase|nr:pantoate--beta-alanine ligase [Candidatus Tenebribacter burtonii]
MKPKLINSIEEMSVIRKQLKGKIGFVPTMGFLHEGHLSLVKEAKKKTDVVIVSIFVNPTQFSANEDLSTYPRNIERDIELLTNLEVDYIFFPTNEQMYPDDFKTWVNVDKITQVLCGKSRPTHFRGVTTIVAKLINIIDPDLIFMGEKDFQQLVVLKQMIKDLNFRTDIVGCSIVREKDGLALSSRNKYLSSSGRKKALCLNKSLLLAQKLYNEGLTSSNEIISQMTNLIENNECIIDYIEVFDPKTLEHIPELVGGCRIALAVIVENTRLIDNIKIV